MGRKLRLFTESEVADLVALFDDGIGTNRIGELRGLSGTMVRRVLKAEFGTDLRTARVNRKARGYSRQHQATSSEYREGFHAGVAQALTWIELHGSEAVRRHCNELLLAWRDRGVGGPPAL